MIKKLALTITCATALLTTSSALFGAAGIYDPFAIVNGTFYDLGATTANPDYQGANLGTFNTTDTLMLGGQQKSFKNNGTDVTGHSLNYSIWQGSPSGMFTNLAYAFQWNAGDPGAPGGLVNPGDQQWGTNVEGANMTDLKANISLASFAPGTYTLELYSQINTNGVDAPATIYNNNGGANFTATFTVVPEPTTLTLLTGPSLLGGWLFLRRRRA